jgi:hypothetical protein
MDEHRRSYRKTVLAAVAATLAGLAVTVALIRIAWPAAVVPGLLALWTTFVVTGGLIALSREALESRGVPYGSRAPREWVAGPWVRALRRGIRGLKRVLGGAEAALDLRAGDLVEVKSLDEILETLDDRGALNALPFMAEMSAFCGRQFRVLRRVDKLNDWVGHTGLRRVRKTVLLEDVRCSGAAHGGCQASCHLRWNEAWLRRVPEPAHSVPVAPARRRLDLERLALRSDAAGGQRYVCQATELVAGTTPLAWADPRHWWRDWATGNVRLRPLLTGVAIACFNWVQSLRGGVRYPALALPDRKTSPHATLDLQPGELVRVKPKREIEPTLTAGSRNRGLWFDAEMLRFCGGAYRVERRVERLIDERTGQAIHLSSPAVLLEGITASGEYSAFNPEDESIFWREIWLSRVPGSAGPA